MAELADAPDLGSGVRKDVPVRLRSAPLHIWLSAIWLSAIGIGLSAIALSAAESREQDPFAFLSPTIQISAADRARIERGETIVNIIPAKGHEISMVAISPTTMSPERLVQWSSDTERLKATPQVLRVKRLSAKPGLDEFAQLTLPEADIRDIRSCRPESCNVKLTEAEIERMHSEMQKAGSN